MELSLHFVTNLILAIVCLSMGTIFLTIPVPQKPALAKYRISLKVIASSYFLLAFLTLVVIFLKLPDNAREYLTFTVISISSFQAYLFTFALITLLDPKFVNGRYLFLHLTPILILSVLFFTLTYFFDDPVIAQLNEIGLYKNNPLLWVRAVFYLFYVFQLIYYTQLFIREEKRYKLQIMNYFSDDYWLKSEWVRVAFFAALLVGTLSLISCFLPKKIDWLVTLVFAIFYFGYALEYVKYNKIYTIVEPALEPEKNEAPAISPKSRIKQEWQPLKKQIIENQYYLESGINIEEIAHRLGIGRTVLSTLINREENMNFNTWINTLRINMAKDILINYPDESLSVIAEMVGYTEHANFSRQFKLITGEPPLLWKKKQLTTAKVF